ncbi:MAG: hypothetical protein GDYSWBUE_002165 [Candidatus Fervidibacterota bacterium]
MSDAGDSILVSSACTGNFVFLNIARGAMGVKWNNEGGSIWLSFAFRSHMQVKEGAALWASCIFNPWHATYTGLMHLGPFVWGR